jgi:CHAD domain-containing protein
MGERAGTVLFSQWVELCRLRTLVLDRGDIDSIHDLRVASRRLRSTSGLFEPIVEGVDVRDILKQIRRVTRKLGRLRNVDEAIVYFGAWPGQFPVLTATLRTIRELEMKAVAAVLNRFPRPALEREVREMVAALAAIPPDDPLLTVYFSETSIQRFQAVHDLLLPAMVPENVEERHALRIAIKKWRYLLETLGQICRQDYSAALANLKGYQTLLGSLNDLSEFGELCGSLDIPDDEHKAAGEFLSRDAATSLASFIETAASRPPQYTFML